MPILLTCTCGKKLKVNEDKIGKKVKCPGCQSILTVPASEAEDAPEPPVKAKPTPPPPEEDEEMEAPVKAKPKPPPPDEDDEVPEPPRKAKTKPPPEPEPDENEDEEVVAPPKKEKDKKKTPAAPKKSRLGFFIVLAIILLLALCGVGGLGIYYAYQAKLFGDSSPVIVPKKDGVKLATDGKAKVDGKIEQNAVIEPRARFKADMGVTGNGQEITSVLLAQDGQRVAVVNGKFKSQVWDIADEPKKVRDFDRSITAISPDGKRLVVSGAKGMFIADPESEAEVGPIRFGRAWFASPSVLWTLEYSSFANPKGRKTFTARSFDVETGKMDKEIPGEHKSDAMLLIDSKAELAFVSASREVNFWDIATEKWARQLTLKPDAGDKLLLAGATSHAVSADGKWLLAPTGQGIFDPAVFNLATGDAMKIPKQGMFPRTPAFIPKRDILMVNKSAAVKKDQLVAYDLKTNAVVATFGTVEPTVHSLAISADGNTMVAGSSEGEVVIWDLKKWK